MQEQQSHFISSIELTKRYLTFFRAHGHRELDGSPLAVAGNSTSFVIAGMQPLLPYLRGERIPPSRRLTAIQRCLRSDDSDAVGLNGRKNSFFHMLGNWSIGDYDKPEAIALALDFLLNQLGLDVQQLWVTVFAGEPELCLLPDTEAMAAWQNGGIAREHIVMLGVEDNLWTMGDGPGPCGPCTEIFVDRGPATGCGSVTCQPGCACERFVEVWNLVFMEYERLSNGLLAPLPWHNIDTGMGLERMAAVLQGAESVFAIDLFAQATQRLQEFAPVSRTRSSTSELRARCLILDHTRAALFACLAGVQPGHDGRNSVVRRLVRRAARQGRVLGIEQPFLGELIGPLAQGHTGLLSAEESSRLTEITDILTHEEKLFERVLTSGLRYLAQLQPDTHGTVSGLQLFTLHAEKGFPADLASEVLAERGLSVDWSSYKQAAQAHRQISRVSVETHFRALP